MARHFIGRRQAARLRHIELAQLHHRPRLDGDRRQAVAQRLGRGRLEQEFVHAGAQGLDHGGALGAVGQHDDRQIGTRKHAGRAHDAHHLHAVEHRHIPIEQHDVGVAGADLLERGEAVGGLDHRLGAEIHQHRARQPAHIMIAVDDQDVEALQQSFDRIVMHGDAIPLPGIARNLVQRLCYFTKIDRSIFRNSAAAMGKSVTI